jgi:tRNA threonylcarbamoyladenosine biosynthesis protein TsaE
MVTRISKSPEDTMALGEEWGRLAKRGWIIGLSGDLGAGKTQFVRGLARGLGATSRVHSPTFALLNEYHGGRLRLFHLDLYRLHGGGDIRAAGLEEYLVQPDGVAVVEWIERWQPADAPSEVRHVRFETMGETDRVISYEDPRA